MSLSNFDTIKKNCVFVLLMQDPVIGLQKVLHVFSERGIHLESLHLQSDPGSTGVSRVMICACMEKDRIYRTLLLLRRVTGVMEAEKMEGK